MVLICGLLGTLLGLGIYERFLDWINLLALTVPPVIGPVLADYYLFGGASRRRYDAEPQAALNIAALLGFIGGAWIAKSANDPGTWLAGLQLAPSLTGLLGSVLIYCVVRPLETAVSGKD